MSAPPPPTQGTSSTTLGIHIEMLESANVAPSRRNEEAQTLLRELIKNNMKLTEKILQSRKEHEKEKDLAELRQKREERKKLEREGALVLTATATKPELIVTDPDIIAMVHQHVDKAIREGKLEEKDVSIDGKLTKIIGRKET